jgi:hypothetical protein
MRLLRLSERFPLDYLKDFQVSIFFLNLLKKSDFYDMNHKNRGIALIISFDRLDFDRNLILNDGFNVDADRLKNSFTNLGFEIHYYSSFNKSNFEEIIEAYSQRDFTDDDCFVCVILGHGNAAEQVTCADNKGYTI